MSENPIVASLNQNSGNTALNNDDLYVSQEFVALNNNDLHIAMPPITYHDIQELKKEVKDLKRRLEPLELQNKKTRIEEENEELKKKVSDLEEKLKTEENSKSEALNKVKYAEELKEMYRKRAITAESYAADLTFELSQLRK